MWGVGLRADGPDAHDPHLWRGKNLPGQIVLPSATSFATIPTGWHTRPLLLNSALRYCPKEFIKLTPHRWRVFGFQHVLGPVLLRGFRPIFPTHQRITTPMCWLLPLAQRPPSRTRPRSPSTARASSEARLRSTKPLLPSKFLCIAVPPTLQVLVVSRS